MLQITRRTSPSFTRITSHAVSVQGRAYLQDRGPQPTSHGVAYSMLVALYDQDSSDKIGSSIIAELKGVLAGQDMWEILFGFTHYLSFWTE